MAIFLKGTQNGQNAKGGPFAKFSILAIFDGRTLLGYKISRGDFSGGCICTCTVRMTAQKLSRWRPLEDL